MYYLGIDGGGHYSRLVGVDEKGKAIGRHAGNGLRLTEGLSLEMSAAAFTNHLHKLVSGFNKLTNTVLEECQGVCIGLSNYHPHLDGMLTACLEKIGLPLPGLFVSDRDMLLATEAKGQPGVLVYSGPHSYGYGRDDEYDKIYSGGWGHQIDAGSGFHIGMQTIRAAFAGYDEKRANDLLLAKVLEHFQVANIFALKKYLEDQDFPKVKITELSLLLTDNFETDERIAAIESQAATDLFFLVKTLLDKGQLAKPFVILTGSILLTNENIQRQLTAQIKKAYPTASVCLQKQKPEMGAAYLALHHAEKQPE